MLSQEVGLSLPTLGVETALTRMTGAIPRLGLS